MIKFNNDVTKLEFTVSKVEYDQNGVHNVIYTDSPSVYSQLPNVDTTVTNFQVSSFTPDPPQQYRLDMLNNMNAIEHQTLIEYFDVFVDTGAIITNDPFFDSIREQFEHFGKEYAISKLKEAVKNIRRNKEQGGYKFGEFVCATDRESQSTLSNLYGMFTSGMIQETEFKFNNGWKILNKEEFFILASGVSRFVQACFKAENELVTELSKSSTTEINELVIEEDHVTLKDKYDQVVASLLQ